jgi:Na+-driven multidrug efflux pump
MSLQPLLGNLMLMLLTGLVGSLGTTSLAGFGAAVRLEYVLYPLAFGLGAGVLAMVGTNIGAGQPARAARIAWSAAALAAGVTGAIGLLGVMWPDAWVGFFSADPAIHVMAGSYLCIAGFAYPFLGLGLTLSSAFQAAGRPLWPLLGIAGRVLVIGGGGWLVIHTTDTGLVGLAFVTAAGLIVYGGILAIAFRAGEWRAVSGGPQ